MNAHHQTCLFGSEEEALVIERALRTAVLSVVEVINSINQNRLKHYQTKVTEKEKENVQLRAELDKAEQELVLLRQVVNFQQHSSECNVDASTSTQALFIDNELNVETSSSSWDEDGISYLQSNAEQSRNVSKEPLSAAEKQRRYRARRDADPERRANYLEKEKRKWKRDRVLGKKKLIHECSVGEQRVIRRRWKLAKEKSRAAKIDEIDIFPTQRLSSEYLQPHQQEAGHSFDHQFEGLGDKTMSVQNGFDFPTSPSEQHEPVFSGCSENNTGPLVKQEPPTNSVYIKFEVKDERACTEQDDTCDYEKEPPEHSLNHQNDVQLGTWSTPSHYSTEETEDTRQPSPSRLRKRDIDRERQRRYRERIYSDPEKLQAYLEKDRSRCSKRRKIHELPEQIQMERRAKWREATRRSRARKKMHIGQWTEPLSKRGKIHELPEQIQMERRAKWREATRRCRARKKMLTDQRTEPL